MAGDIKRGFVFKRVPHITLKSIANNEEIDAIHSKWQEQLEANPRQADKAVKQEWEEWQIPHEADEAWSAKAIELHAEWWRLRRERQREIDDSIARRADTELLYDQPYEDRKRIRVTGPFTAESSRRIACWRRTKSVPHQKWKVGPDPASASSRR